MAKSEWNQVTAAGYSSVPDSPVGPPTTASGGRQRSNRIEDEDASLTARGSDHIDEPGSLFDRPGRYRGGRSSKRSKK